MLRKRVVLPVPGHPEDNSLHDPYAVRPWARGARARHSQALLHLETTPCVCIVRLFLLEPPSVDAATPFLAETGRVAAKITVTPRVVKPITA